MLWDSHLENVAIDMSGHIVLVEPSGRGGVAHYTCQLAEGLSTLGAVVHMHSSIDWNLLPKPNYRVFRLFRRWGVNPFTFLPTVWSERRQNTAVVHWQSATHPNRLRLLQMAWRPKGSIRWVHTIHNVLPHDDDTPGAQAQYLKLYGSADGLIFHAEASRKRFTERFPTLSRMPHAIIPMGHFGFLAPWTENAPPLEERRRSILFFGTIRPYKGLMDLLEAFALVRERVKDAHLTIVGRPCTPWEEYEDAIERLHLKPAITTRLGYIPEAEVPTVLAQVRVACLPYHDIDQSGVLLLAMAAGLPVVASRTGGIVEVLRDGETGLLTPPRDVNALANALIELLENDRKLTAMGARAKELTETDYSWQHIALKTLKFYSSLGANLQAPYI